MTGQGWQLAASHRKQPTASNKHAKRLEVDDMTVLSSSLCPISMLALQNATGQVRQKIILFCVAVYRV